MSEDIALCTAGGHRPNLEAGGTPTWFSPHLHHLLVHWLAVVAPFLRGPLGLSQGLSSQ